MRLGVVQRPSDPLSLAGHRQRLVDALAEGGVLALSPYALTVQ